MRHDRVDPDGTAGRIAERRNRGSRADLRRETNKDMSLFDDEPEPASTREPVAGTPLAERVRPRTLDEIVGQDDMLAPGKPLRDAIERDLIQSIILWGPPGTGQTTLARVIAETTKAYFVPFSAVLSGIDRK